MDTILTPKQKDTLSNLVSLVQEGKLPVTFLVTWYGANKTDIIGLDESPPQVTKGDLDALSYCGFIIYVFETNDSARVPHRISA
jgi:hypothetical protein